MVKNWIRFVCFCFISLFLFGFLNSATSKANQGWKDFYKLPRNSLDVVFMGNSINYQTFQPQIIDDLLPIDSFVLGTSGENIVVSYYELKEILKYQKPKVVVLETFTLDLTDLLVPAFIYQFIDASYPDINRLALQFSYYSLSEFYNYFPIFRLRINWDDPVIFVDEIENTSASKKSAIDPKRGFITNNLVILPDEYLEASSPISQVTNYSLEKNKKYLDKFVRLCKENDIQLFFSVVPPLRITEDQLKCYMPFDHLDYAKKNKIDIIPIDISDFKEIDYYDASHVSIFGSVLTNIQMAEALAGKMGLNIDDKKLAFYQSLRFSGYSFEQSGDKITFSLTPSDLRTLLVYQYAVKGSESNHVIFSTDWTSAKSIQFSLPDYGDYYVEVNIRNLEEDYVLTGIFRNFSAEEKLK